MSAEERRPVVASYCATFLKPEMLHLYRQLQGLRAFRPFVLTQKRELPEQFPFRDLQVVPRGSGRWWRKFWQRQLGGCPVTLSRAETQALLRAVRDCRAELLHVYFGHIAVQLLPLLAVLPLPRVVSFHGADVLVDLHRPKFRAMTAEMLDRATLVLARSRSLLDALAALGCPPEKLRLHRTGIPLGQFAYRPRGEPADGQWRLLQACRLIEKKGLPVTLRAFAEFAQTWPAARLTIAGEGPLEVPLRALAADLGIAAQVDFTGFLSQDDLREKLYAAHLFLHPSELGPDGNQEGVPNSLLEAMATGLPVFATKHGGIPEAVEHLVSGWLGDAGAAGELGRALLEAVADPARLAKWGAAAAESVAENFEQGAQAARLEGYYREAIAAFDHRCERKR